MKIDVLSIGSFPARDECRARAAGSPSPITCTGRRPQRSTPRLKARIRAIATEANRGADRALIAALPKLEIDFGVRRRGRRVDLAAARDRGIPVTNTPGVTGRRGRRSRHRHDARLGAPDPGRRPLRARRATGQQRARSRSAAASAARPWAWSASAASAAPSPTAVRPSACASSISGPRQKPDAPYDYVADLVELARQSDYLMVACKGGPDTQAPHLGGRDRRARSRGHADQCRARLGGR